MSEWSCKDCAGTGDDKDGEPCPCCEGLGYHGGGVDCRVDVRLALQQADEITAIPFEDLSEISPEMLEQLRDVHAMHGGAADGAELCMECRAVVGL